MLFSCFVKTLKACLKIYINYYRMMENLEKFLSLSLSACGQFGGGECGEFGWFL